jgi:hypothetical protein
MNLIGLDHCSGISWKALKYKQRTRDALAAFLRCAVNRTVVGKPPESVSALVVVRVLASLRWLN